MDINKPEVIFQDQDILIFNKPAGMIVNNADTSRDVFTLQDFIDNNFPTYNKFPTDKNFPLEKNSDENDFSKRSGIVHRLDKETSGAIIVARNLESFDNLQKQFKERSIQKTYMALVHGRIVNEGSVNVPIGRLPWNRMRFGVVPSGRESYTEFKVVKYYSLLNKKQKEILSLIEVMPKTGRTHQIRVHMQYAGFPIFGDALYAGRKTYKEDKKFLNRHFLHASKIIFNHPKSGAVLNIEAPIKSDLQDLLNTLNPEYY